MSKGARRLGRGWWLIRRSSKERGPSGKMRLDGRLGDQPDRTGELEKRVDALEEKNRAETEAWRSGINRMLEDMRDRGLIAKHGGNNDGGS